ncbi:TerB N-terminal domain-containing protein [Chthoniobacter sp.]|uniref:tellurite resistance TerB family protein n=1 Tax=Chthoniobacter sp. TaxID=2510640 RepID=UPI0032B00F91
MTCGVVSGKRLSMRWLIGIIGAFLLGRLAGWQGALVGFVVGFIVGTWIAKKFQKSRPSAMPPTSARRARQTEPAPIGKPAPVPRAATRESAISIDVSFGTDSSSERRTGRSDAKLTWHPPGQPVSHEGLRIGSGMIYATDRPLRWPGEPSAIITSATVARTAAHPSQDFGYYPSYEHLPPEQRRCYLEWLAAGREDADPSQRSLGYVFMFFYGLERRILVEGDRDPVLLDEIVRLLQHYGPVHKSRSLKSYLLQLLHFTGWQLGADYYRALWPRLLEFDGERPDQDGMRFVLANLHQRGEPLDWTVAYRIAMGNEESRRSTVVTKARDKFWELFEQRFNQQFPGGMVLQAAKQQALVQYRPASNALIQMSYERKRGNQFELRLPNVAGLHRQFKALPEIWNSCVDDLSGYSRALSSKKQGQAAALAAWQALPPDLRRAEEHPARVAFDELVAAAPREGDYIFAPVSVLAALAGIDERAKLTAGQSRQVAELVLGLGWQLAPNPDVTGLPLAWNQELALYASIPGESIAPHVSGLVRLLYLAVTLAAADGVIEPEELDSFHQLIASQIQHESDWRPLRATEASLRRDANVALRSLPQMAKLIPEESRPFVLRTMAHIAAADNEVTLDELKILRRMARAFELDPGAVEKLLREDEAFREVAIDGAGEKSSGEAIPKRPTEQPAAFALDHDRIKALTQETQEVISMLSVVMAEPEEVVTAPVAAPAAPVEPSAPIEWLSGLDARYHAAVSALVRHDELTTADFDVLAAKHHLMPDDLLNAVNTWADEALGDFLLERGENVRVFRTLLPDTAELPIAA